MIFRRYPFAFTVVLSSLILLLSVLRAEAQIFEDFEAGSKNAYAAGVVSFATGEWLLDDALVGQADGDRKFGERSIRIRDGFLQMQFDAEEGAGVLSFWGSNSGFSGDRGGSVQVYYSIDEGNSWYSAGEAISLTEENSLEYYVLELNIAEPVRFRFNKASGNRINIDDVTIEPFIELSDTPRLTVREGQEQLQSGSELNFETVNINQSSKVTLRLSNTGLPDLEISSIQLLNNEGFSVTESLPETLQSRESADLNVTFSSETGGLFEDQLVIQTNEPDQTEFVLTMLAFAVDENEIIPISQTRSVPFGTRVTVEGTVTVANEFNGPVFIQDDTGAIAVFYEPLHTDVERGDRIRVTGPVTEFNPISGTSGTFLRQIAVTDTDSAINYEITERQAGEIEPDVVTIARINSGEFESALVTIENVTFQAEGVFQGNQNYSIADPTGSGVIRIGNSVTDLIGAPVPDEPVKITGVIDRFNRVYQLKPRDNQDLQVVPFEIEGEDIPRNLTFDLVTWNIEWFGANDRGPEPDQQMENVIEVIETINADLYALQEITNVDRFNTLVDRLPDYRGFLANYSQRQRTGYLFKTAVIDSLDAGLLTDGQESFDWAGRLPLFFEFDATIEGVTRRITSFNVHAKAFGDRQSFLRRQNAAASLKTYLDSERREDNIIFIGDFNDQLNFSTYNEEVSPYQVFLDDEHYYAVTKNLEDRGFASYLVGQFRSMIDHIIVTNELIEDHIDGSQRVENPNYIVSFISTTSDHAPVWSRFQFSGSNDDDFELPENFTVQPNYPNPFNPATTLRFSISEPAEVTIQVFDILGRKVALLTDRRLFTAGNHTVVFDAGNLSSGTYLYRVELNSGESKTKKMLLVR
ncbi:MAG: T9SS C-terminal target domain-containing protein [Balneolaceae bacterium]|nr:MAG: T9SS C-terminal target domain-containing protein [Balneolaceae bacterium]